MVHAKIYFADGTEKTVSDLQRITAINKPRATEYTPDKFDHFILAGESFSFIGARENIFVTIDNIRYVEFEKN